MFPEKFLEVLKHEGVVAIGTLGPEGPHMVNTWNSYLKLADGKRIVIPAGMMFKTEANVSHDSNVLLTLGSRKVMGKNGPGTGFLVKGTASFATSGEDFDLIKMFKWARAALVVTVTSIEQTL